LPSNLFVYAEIVHAPFDVVLSKLDAVERPALFK